jgi:hypothetical protein
VTTVVAGDDYALDTRGCITVFKGGGWAEGRRVFSSCGCSSVIATTPPAGGAR